MVVVETHSRAKLCVCDYFISQLAGADIENAHDGNGRHKDSGKSQPERK
jgi:hypothetical protein